MKGTWSNYFEWISSHHEQWKGYKYATYISGKLHDAWKFKNVFATISMHTYSFYVNDAKLFFSTTSFTNFRTSEKISRFMNTFYSLLGLEIKFSAFDDLLHQVDFSRKRSERIWYFYICEIFPPLWKWITYFLQTWLVAKFDMKVDINTFQWEIYASFWDVFLIPKVWWYRAV